MKTPFAHHVPDDMAENLRWRSKVFRRAMDDVAFIGFLRDACAKDPIFFLNGFGWTYDPRREPFPKLPFILYDFQRTALCDILDSIGKNDLLIEKSRDMGASWLCVCAMMWRWMFRPMQSFLFVSRVEEYVDSSGNPKSLFFKVDFLLDNLPLWLRPEGYNKNDHRRKMHIENPTNGSVVDGESTTGNVARGDRRTAILLDEFAVVEQGHRVLSSTRDATNCRLFNSTPAGTNNAFYDMRETNVRKLRLHWSAHYLKGIGLYTMHNGTYSPLDSAYWDKVKDPTAEMIILDRKIIDRGVPLFDGKMRSPWYANECERAATAQEIAQEIDIDYLGSGFQFFNSDRVQEAINKFAKLPVVTGDLEFDDTLAEPIRFREERNGCLKVWCSLGEDYKPPTDHQIVIGVDVSAGTGTSNSCLAGYDVVTHEKVLEYASPFVRPEAFAKLAVSVARWWTKPAPEDMFTRRVRIAKPFLIWEANGPGRQFGSRVMELGYSNVYLRKNDASITKKVSDIPGWAPTKETKLVLLGDYRAAIEAGQCINRSREALEETLEYVFAPNGGVVHARAASKGDPSGANANHGDRAMADALAWKLIGERMVTPRKAEVEEVPVGCLAWRLKMNEEAKKPAYCELSSGW